MSLKGDDFRRAECREFVRVRTQLVRAKDLQDVMKLQADYIKRQMQAFSEQARSWARARPRRRRRRLRRNGEPSAVPAEKELSTTHLIVQRNISIALHQSHAICPHQARRGASGQDGGCGRLSSASDRLWAQIRAMPDHRPKGQFHD
jgi:hypothetical protein